MSAIYAASEAVHVVNELPFPAFFFGLITLVILGSFVLVTMSYGSVANRHSEKAEKYAREHGGEHGQGH